MKNKEITINDILYQGTTNGLTEYIIISIKVIDKTLREITVINHNIKKTLYYDLLEQIAYSSKNKKTKAMYFNKNHAKLDFIYHIKTIKKEKEKEYEKYIEKFNKILKLYEEI